eukprot:4680106-Pleurochrysis_carterae.AAC.1
MNATASYVETEPNMHQINLLRIPTRAALAFLFFSLRRLRRVELHLAAAGRARLGGPRPARRRHACAAHAAPMGGTSVHQGRHTPPYIKYARQGIRSRTRKHVRSTRRAAMIKRAGGSGVSGPAWAARHRAARKASCANAAACAIVIARCTSTAMPRHYSTYPISMLLAGISGLGYYVFLLVIAPPALPSTVACARIKL